MNNDIISKEPEDPLLARAMKFAKSKNALCNNTGISNLYVLRTIDKTGNVTSEKYGMNLMTDYGMTRYFIDNVTFPKNVYIGSGVGTFDKTTNVLLTPLTTTSSTLSNGTISYKYPLYYDSTSGMITCVCKYIEAYFSYNIDTLTNSDVTITEYGIGTAVNQLWTHSWVYDSTGAVSTITKKVDERLNITVYMCMSYNESLITDGYSLDRYMIITSMQRFFDNRMYEDSIYTYKRFNVRETRDKSNTSSKFENNQITRYTNMSSFVMYAGTDSKSGYIDGFCQMSSGFTVLEPQILDTAENVDFIIYANNSTINGISDTFGRSDNNNVPITQIDVSSVKMFDHKTNSWSNSETYENSAAHHYCETPLSTLFSTPIYYSNNNEYILMYVFQNIHINDPIVKFDSNLTTVYATDKYWDTSSWVLITNLNEIPVALQTKRYYITPSNSTSLVPTRNLPVLHVIPTGGGITTLPWAASSIGRGCSATCSNYAYGWYARGYSVYVPGTGFTFNTGSSGSEFADNMFTYDKWLVDITPSSIFAFDMSGTISAKPATITIVPSFTSNINYQTGCYETESKTGLICIQSLSTSEAFVVDLRTYDTSKGFTKNVLLNTTMSSCISGTKQVAYIATGNNIITLKIYDFDLNSDIKEIELPTGFTPVIITGLQNYVWISNGTNTTYVINTEDSSISSCSTSITTSGSICYYRTTAVDDALILYDSSESLYNISKAFCVTTKKPLAPTSLSPYKINNNSLSDYLTMTLQYVHGNTLVLIIACTQYMSNYGYPAYNIVTDFGNFLYDLTANYYTHANQNDHNVIPYGEFLVMDSNRCVPIEYCMQHRIQGTTKTISTLNHIKGISGKQWNTIFTNVPSFYGKPPGTIQ